MERDQSSPAPRKHKFAPKAPPRRAPKSTAPKTEVDDEDGEAEQVQYLLRRFNENHARRRLNDEKKSSIQVAFGPGETPSTQIKRYGSAKDGNGGKSSGSDTKSSDYGQTLLSLPSAANENVREACSADSTSKYGELVKKEYREPWDYHNTYYPTTLPWRRPHSGDPELLDEAEFGEAAANAEYNENAINPASELELMEEMEEEKMFLFKLPDNLPLLKRASSRKGKEKVDAHTSSDGGGVLNMGCRLEELPGGYMGKMLVYKSGAIKLKLGDALYDLEGPSQVYFCLGLRTPVSPGSDCTYAQDVAAINLAEKRCCVLGKLDKRAVIDPDVDSLLDAVINLD